MDSRDTFLSIDPVATVVWPEFLIQSRISQKVRKCDCPKSFWPALGSAFAAVPHDKLAPKQSSVIAERIVSITKMEGIEAQLSMFFPPALDVSVLDATLREQVHDVQIIANYLACAPKDLLQTVAKLKVAVARASGAGDANPISTSLCVFPAGRLLVSEATLYTKRADAMLEAFARASTVVDLHLQILKEMVAAKTWPSTSCNSLNTQEIDSALEVPGPTVAGVARVRSVVRLVWCLRDLAVALLAVPIDVFFQL